MISNQRKNQFYLQNQFQFINLFLDDATNLTSLETQLNSSQLRLNKYISDLILYFETCINKKIQSELVASWTVASVQLDTISMAKEMCQAWSVRESVHSWL